MSNLKKVLVIGAGAVVIGQSSEYDYACVLACEALKKENIEVILLNPNPVTISTDTGIADKVYFEPINIEIVKKIIEKDNIDAVLPTIGGDAGFKIGLELTLNGYLEENGIKLLGVNPNIISTISNRKLFKEFLNDVGESGVSSKVVCSSTDAINFAQEIGYPVLVRPAYTLNSNCVVSCDNKHQLESVAKEQLSLSKIGQIFIEKSIYGWKEIEYEVVRDSAGNCICVCNMENIDPAGIHTGDSVVVIPAQTLTDKEANALKCSALHLANEIGIEGCCNIKIALKPDGSEYAILGMYPRVGRTSALVSKATGYKIVDVTIKIALGYKLFEIENKITGCTTAASEPAIDYCAVKMPTWSFNSFNVKHKKLGTSMQATGEVLGIAPNFELALMKSIRSVDSKIQTLSLDKFKNLSNEELIKIIKNFDNQRMFAIYEAIKRGISFKEINNITSIDYWYLSKLSNIASVEGSLGKIEDKNSYIRAKEIGFTDDVISKYTDISKFKDVQVKYNTVDTCAAEFDVNMPYFYLSWDDDNEAQLYNDINKSSKKKILVVGSGPSKINQGIELDYAVVNVVNILKQRGFETIIINNNPEAVSTSFEIADKLYFEPITSEDVANVVKIEKPFAVITQFCGCNASNITKAVENLGVKILGVKSSDYDTLENKTKINMLLDELSIPHRDYKYVNSVDKIVEESCEIGFPVSVKTDDIKFIAYNSTELEEQIQSIDKTVPKILIEKYFIGIGINVNSIFDGNSCVVPCICEHIERAGVNTGDSITVTPPITLSEKVKNQVLEYTSKISKSLKVNGILNFEFVYFDNNVYLLNIKAGAVKTVPFSAKSTGINIINLAVSCMFEEKHKSRDLNYSLNCNNKVAVRVPVFSFDKISGIDTQLDIETKSTGEVIGIAENFEDALLKALSSSNMRINKKGGLLITVRDADKQDSIAVADKFSQLGFSIYATAGTAKVLNQNFVASNSVRKINEGNPNIIDLLSSNKIDYVISTSTRAKTSSIDDVLVRRKAVERGIPTLTSVDTANAIASCLKMKRSLNDLELFDIYSEGE